ncbi:MAG: ATP-binding protein [Acidobacteriota bacterium]
MHRLLQRQIRETFGPSEELPGPFAELLSRIDDSYRRADEEKQRLERALERTSAESLQAKAGLRKRAEEALARSEQKYRRLFEESRDVIFITGADSKLQDINPAGVELFGFDSRDEMLDADLAQMIYRRPGDREGFLQQVIDDGVVRNQQLDLQRVDGEKVCVLASATAIRGDDGQVLGIRGILRDVTEQRAIEHQLQQSQKMEAVGRLAGGVAHDFNNLLTAVIGYADLLAAQLEARGERPSHLEQILGAADRGADLVRQLLAFSRQQALRPKVVDLNHVVSGIEKLLGRVIGEDVKLTTELEPELGAILADPNQLEQVVLNLVVNGREAMPEGGTLTLRTRNLEAGKHPLPGTEIRHSQVVLEIEDTGCGIEESQLDQIFEPFYTTKSAGTGLGLATVYGIVKQSDGQIRVDSRPGEGTRFSIYLPEVSGEPESERQAAEQRGLPGGNETILIVEDESAVRNLLRQFLTTQGYRVHTARDGVQGWRLFERRHGEIDLLLTDIVMPRMGGQELAQKMRDMRPDLCVLYMSGYSEKQPALLEQIEGSQETSFLQKPFTIETLANALRELLDPIPRPIVAARFLDRARGRRVGPHLPPEARQTATGSS